MPPLQDPLARVLAAQFSPPASARPFVIVIDGPGCCGKSTLTEALQGHLDAAVLATDDFHLPRGVAPEDGSPLPYRRWGEFLAAVRRLSDGQPARVQPIDWTTHQLSSPITVEPKPFLVIEGIAAMHPAIARFANYRIWVDGRAATRMDRVAHRDGAGEVPRWSEYVAFEQRYLQDERPWRFADLWVFGAALETHQADASFSRLIDVRGFALAR